MQPALFVKFFLKLWSRIVCQIQILTCSLFFSNIAAVIAVSHETYRLKRRP